MFKWTQFPFIRISFFLILGIVWYEQASPGLPATALAFVISLVTFLFFARFTTLKLPAGIAGFLSILLLGTLSAHLHDPTHDNHHFTRLENFSQYAAIVKERGEDRGKTLRYLLELVSVCSTDSTLQPATGMLYLYIRKPDSAFSIDHLGLRPGSEIFVDAEVRSVPPPGSEFAFDYRLYLQRKHIYGQSFATIEDIEVLSSRHESGLLHWSGNLRDKLLASLRAGIESEREFQIASAIMLGIKDYLSDDVRDAYAAAGAMHILAVSGLHVGIFYLLVSQLFAWLLPGDRFKIPRLINTILLIFSYAIVTGLSASVFRAAVMFSVIAARVLVSRKSSIYNSLGFAAFILLLYNPNFLFDVGFRLSFAAVFGIVMLHPLLYSLWQPQNALLDKLWSLGCVSIAAQLATFPLSTHYFHQFPSYFLFANFFAIPAAFVILVGGFIFWLLYFVGFPWISFFANLYEGIIWLTNELIFFFEKLPGSVVDGLYLEMSESLVLYALVLLVGIGLAYRSFITISSGLSLAIVFLLSIHYRDFQQRQQWSYIFYDTQEGLAVDYVTGKHVDSYVSDGEVASNQFNFTMKPVRVGLGLPLNLRLNNEFSTWQHNELFSIHTSDSLSIVLLHQNPTYFEFRDVIDVDYLVICSNTLDDLSAITGKFDIGCLVMAADVPVYLVDKLKEQADQLGIATYSLAQQGMLKIEII